MESTVPLPGFRLTSKSSTQRLKTEVHHPRTVGKHYGRPETTLDDSGRRGKTEIIDTEPRAGFLEPSKPFSGGHVRSRVVTWTEIMQIF